MRAQLTKDHTHEEGGQPYVKGQIVKGATAKALVAAGVAEDVPEPKVIFARMSKTALGVPEGAIVKGENAEIAIKAGIAEEVPAAEIQRPKPVTVIGHKATITAE